MPVAVEIDNLVVRYGEKAAVDGLSLTVTGGTVTSVLGGTTWVGPARQQFEDDWNLTFRTALDRLKSAFDAAGADCIRRSNDLALVMGAR